MCETPKGTPLHLLALYKTLNQQLKELDNWLGDPMNWNDHIDYMIEVLQGSRMEKEDDEEW